MGDDEPDNAVESTEQAIRGLAAGLPQFLETIRQELPRVEQSLLDVKRNIAPQEAALNLELFRDFGPGLNEIGSQISAQNLLAERQSEADVLRGPGQDLISTALDQLIQVDPQFEQVRNVAGDSLTNAIRALSGPIGEAERESIHRNLARRQETLGLTGVPSNTESISQALVFGDRQNSRRSQLLSALQTATGFLPASRTGFDPIQIALNRSGIANQGANRQGLAGEVGQETFGSANNVFNAASQFQSNVQQGQSASQQTGIQKIGEVGNILGGFI